MEFLKIYFIILHFFAFKWECSNFFSYSINVYSVFFYKYFLKNILLALKSIYKNAERFYLLFKNVNINFCNMS